MLLENCRVLKKSRVKDSIQNSLKVSTRALLAQ
jgi:hypothetical protein